MRISDWSSDVCSSDLTPRIRRRAHGDGGFILESEEPLGSYADHAGLLLQKHAGARPDAVFIAERSVTAADGWRRITYGEAWAAARRIAQSLLDRGPGQQEDRKSTRMNSSH